MFLYWRRHTMYSRINDKIELTITLWESMPQLYIQHNKCIMYSICIGSTSIFFDVYLADVCIYSKVYYV